MLIQAIEVRDQGFAFRTAQRSTNAVASNSRVYYVYYLGLTKIDGDWKIQTFLQRSRPARSDNR